MKDLQVNLAERERERHAGVKNGWRELGEGGERGKGRKNEGERERNRGREEANGSW